MELAVADIGGTHARFALAHVDGASAGIRLPWVAKVADHSSLMAAWRAFAAHLRSAGEPVPRRLSIAIAGTVNYPDSVEPIRFTNNPWTIDPGTLAQDAQLDEFHLLNDFVAIAHAAASAPDTAFATLCGPAGPLPRDRPITLIGPGTGTGIALLRRSAPPFIQGTEGAHFDFAPIDAFDDALLARLRAQHGRVSAERVVSGSGLAHMVAVLAGSEPQIDIVALWHAGLSGSDAVAAQAIERFCMALGSVAGDVALAQGSKAVIVAGGLGQRLAGVLPRSGFEERFCAKGRYRAVMQGMKVRILMLEEPGLLGAALAFAARPTRR